MKSAVVIILLSALAPSFASAQAGNPALASELRLVKARALPLDAVRLTGGPLKRAQDLELEYLLALEPNRMLAFLRRSAKLEPKAQGYGGWDGDGRQLTGHIAGHYLSGVSLAWAATGDPRFKERVDYIVNELKLIQDAQGDGYVGALMDRDRLDGKTLFQQLSKGIIRSGGFDLNGLWSPWYVQHKIYAGLRDAWRYTGNRTALDVEIKFAAWAESILSPLSDEQIQRMLATEFGGMNEVLADLYADTGDARWLALAGKFHHVAIIDRLAERRKDVLPSIHGNTQVPKLYGSLKVYQYTGNEVEGTAAKFFFDEVAQHHTFATGGNTRNEYFGKPDELSNMVDGRTAETCNVYNMIKMARSLFTLQPDTRYADYHERALFNHILASQDPDDGRVCYMVPVGRGVQHEYQGKFQSFTCCVGSAMESHALHADGLYYESGDKLWVNLYAPSVAEWKSAGVKIEVATDMPIGQAATVKVTPQASKKFTLALRRPYWAGAGFSVKVNGSAVRTAAANSFIEIARTWKAGDTVELVMPKTLRKEPLPDNPNRLAVMWGPLVLAGDLGPALTGQQARQGPRPDVPVLVAPDQPVANWLKPVAGKPGTFRTTGVGLKQEIDFAPFYQLPRKRYAVYWDMYTPVEWTKKEAEYRLREEKQKKLEAATISFAQPGQMQAERDANQQGDGSSPVQAEGRFGRNATKWFSYDLAVNPAHPLTLVVTFSNENRGPNACDVLLDGRKVGEQTGPRRSPEQEIRFYDVEYPIPADLIANKSKLTVRFEASNGRSTPTIFGVRIVRSDMQR